MNINGDSKVVYIVEQTQEFCKYRFRVLRFASLRIAKKYLEARYKELMHTTQCSDPIINVTNEKFVTGRMMERCASIETVRDNKNIRYIWNIRSSLEGIPTVEKGNVVANLAKVCRPIKMTEDEVNKVCNRVRELKRKVRNLNMNERE